MDERGQAPALPDAAAPCQHRPQVRLRDIFTMNLFFPCQHCGADVEPAKPWRMARAGLNLLSIAALLLVAFLPLDSSPRGLLFAVLRVAIVLGLFWILSALLLRLAPYVPARESLVAAARDAIDMHGNGGEGDEDGPVEDAPAAIEDDTPQDGG